MSTPDDAIIAANPEESEARRKAAAALARLAASRRPAILLVTHARGGGVARHVGELANLLEAKADVLVLSPHRRSFVALAIRGEAPATLWFHTHHDWKALVGLLREIGISRLHLHHVQGLPPQILSLAREIGCPWDVTVHDFYPFCPQYQLTDRDGRYCGEPDEAGCDRCLASAPGQWPLSIRDWRKAFAELLGGASRVIAPSRDAARRIERRFPGVAVETWPHPDAAHGAGPARKILVLGGISPSKGMKLLEACAHDAKARGLALHFRVLGHLAWPVDGSLSITFTGEYRDDDLPRLVEQERGDAVFFPAQWPETWSYTLSQAIASGLPIVAPAIGAFVERLDGISRATLLPWDSAPGNFNDALMSHATARMGHAQAGSPAGGAEPGAYLDRYLSGTPLSGREASRPPVPRGRVIAPEEALPVATLEELFDDGVRCGNARSLAELRQRIPGADAAVAAAARLAGTEAALADANGRLQSLQEERDRLGGELERQRARTATERARADALESSTSWRLTSPLRALMSFLRR